MLRRRSIPRSSRPDPVPIPSLSPFPRALRPFSFFLYIDVRIPCRLFLSARMGLYDVPSPCRAALREPSSPSPLRRLSTALLASCDSYPDRILYRKERGSGTTTPNPARTFSTAELLLFGPLTSADSRGYKFSCTETHVPLVLNLFA